MGGLVWLWSVGMVVEVALGVEGLGVSYVETPRGWQWCHVREGVAIAPVVRLSSLREECAPREVLHDAPTRAYDYGALPDLHGELEDS